MSRTSVFLCVLALLVSACSPLAVVNTLAGGDAKIERDTAYGSAPRQTLDVYFPQPLKANTDVVVFFYGGAWRSGEKSDYRFAGEALSGAGYITVIPNYRLYPEADWKEINSDGAAAYHWVETHIAAWGGNPRRIFLMGHSAGAYVAAMVALNSSLREHAGSQIKPCGFVGLAGPYDFLPFDADIQAVFSSAKNPRDTQPITYADGHDPAALLITGDSDTRVNPRNSARLAAAIKEQGGPAREIIYPGTGHSGLLISLAQHLRFIAPTLADSVAFMQSTIVKRLEVSEPS